MNLRRLQYIHRHIEKNPKEFETIAQQYQGLVKKKALGEDAYWRELAPKTLKGPGHWNWADSVYNFWVRRETDGTRKEWIKLVDTMLKNYGVAPLKP